MAEPEQEPKEDAAPPAGFVRLPTPGADAFTAYLGPLFAKFEGKSLVLAFRAGKRHSNPIGICHGGVLMTFADVFMAVASSAQGGLASSFLPTISLSGDFLTATPIGAWVEGRTDLLRATRNFVFAQGIATADGTPVLRASGVFKIPSKSAFPVNLAEALRDLIRDGGG